MRGAVRPWGWHQPNVMRLLAEAHGRIVSREALLGAMYRGSAAPVAADAVLNLTIHALRRRLPAGAITTHSGEGYSLLPEVGAAWLEKRAETTA
jgi:DNA-binding response OmpR family regulator